MESKNEPNWQPLRELVPNTPYTMEYLSLMSRKKQLKVKKIGRVWYSTVENIKEFEKMMGEKKEKRKRELQESYREKVKQEMMKERENNKEEILKQVQDDNIGALGVDGEDSGAKINITSEKSIFDSVQQELEEVLQEIKDRDERLRKEYRAYQDIQGGDEIPESYSQAKLVKEKKETAVIADHLITDMGKLLKTVNKVQETQEVPINIRHMPKVKEETQKNHELVQISVLEPVQVQRPEPTLENEPIRYPSLRENNSDDLLSPFIRPVPAPYYQRRGKGTSLANRHSDDESRVTNDGITTNDGLRMANDDLYLDEKSSKIFWIMAGVLMAILILMVLYLFLVIGF